MAGFKTASASICLDSSGQDIVNRLMTKTFDECRAQRISLPGFPDFSPILQALRRNQSVPNTSKTYRVTTQVHDKLLILQSLASKWLANETLSAQCQELVDEHNQNFNPGGGFMMERNVQILCNFVLYNGVIVYIKPIQNFGAGLQE